MDLNQEFPLSIPPSDDGQRLDTFLAARFADVSRSRWSRLIERGFFSVAGHSVHTPATRLVTGQSLEATGLADEELDAGFTGSLQTTSEFRGTAPDILFEDEEILVLNKPVGLTVHPGSGMKLEDTLVAWLLCAGKLGKPGSEHFLSWGEDSLEEGRPGIVHRLDRGTSGCIVVAKNPRALSELSAQFRSREAGRIYWAVVPGRIESLARARPPRFDSLLRRQPCPLALRLQEDASFSFASFLERDPAERTRFRVSAGEGRKAITHFNELAYNSHYSLVRLKLDTGRTHQIRVHLSFLGFAVLGDDTYGGRAFPRLFLHAQSLRLRHPGTGKLMEFVAPLPAADSRWLKTENLWPA